MNKYEEIYNQFQQNKQMNDKYNESGIYAIFALMGQEDSQGHQRKLLYIGKSKNMLKRIASHYTHIIYPYSKESEEHKYQIMRLLHQCGFKLEFDVLSYNTSSLLDEAEGDYIRKYKPPLNTQIPKESGKGWTINPKAKSITVREILGL